MTLAVLCEIRGLSRNQRYKTDRRGRKITAVKVATLQCLVFSHFHFFFLHLKKHVAGQKFHEDEEVKNEVSTWLRELEAEFCDIGIQKLVPRLNKCLDKGGDYVEKQLTVLKSFSLDFVNNYF